MAGGLGWISIFSLGAVPKVVELVVKLREEGGGRQEQVVGWYAPVWYSWLLPQVGV